MNRPEKMNAVDDAMFNALVETGESLKHDNSVRAIVLSGEGKAFCAGLDFGNFQAMGSGESDGTIVRPGEGDRITNRGQQAAYVWTEMPVPVIAAITGVALGAGIQIALAADMRLIAPDARMAVLEIRWGLIPDMTGTQALIDIVGLDKAKELLWTGRMVEGPEAVEMGLATRVSDDPHAEAIVLAREIAGRSPHAIRAGKRLMNSARHVDLKTAFANEAHEMAALIGSPNQVEAVQAYFEKRDPAFADPNDHS